MTMHCGFEGIRACFFLGTKVNVEMSARRRIKWEKIQSEKTKMDNRMDS